VSIQSEQEDSHVKMGRLLTKARSGIVYTSGDLEMSSEDVLDKTDRSECKLGLGQEIKNMLSHDDFSNGIV